MRNAEQGLIGCPPKTPAQQERGAAEAGLFALNILSLLLGLLLFSGCAASTPIEEQKMTQEAIMWPPPPEPPRIAFLKAIEKPRDIGSTQGFFRKLFEIVMGATTDDIIKPYGVAVDSAGRMIVADTAFKRVHIFDIKKSSYSHIDSAGSLDLLSPISVAVDAMDNIYVSDSVLEKIFVYNSSGRFQYAINGAKKPTGIAINAQEKLLYVVDTGEHNIKVHDLKGNLIQTFGKWGGEPGEFNYPVDIAVDKDGDVYVADTMNYRIQIFDKTGKYLFSFGRHGDGTGDFGRPKGVAVDRDGNIYVADALFDTVQIFDHKGNFLLNFGAIGREAGRFWLPCGVFIDNADKIYVADAYNRRVQIFEYLGD